MKRLILFFCICALVTELSAQTAVVVRVRYTAPPGSDTTNWYVSNLGNDSQDGHSTSRPLKTIAGINAQTLQAGDTVFFRKGDTFAGQINVTVAGTVGVPIVVTSYGTGNKPIIKGSETLTNWVQNGSLWACKATDTVSNLHVDGVQQVLARKPNFGTWYGIDYASATKDTIVASEFDAAQTYVGGSVRFHAVAWSYLTKTIKTGSNLDTVIFTSAASWTASTGHGIYVENVKALCDTIGEWFYDNTTDSVYYYPATGVNPNTLSIEGSTTDYGFNTNQNYITVNGLHFKNQVLYGIRYYGTPTGSVIQSNTVSVCKGGGISSSGASATVSSDSVRDCMTMGINVSGSGSTVSDNVVQRIGKVNSFFNQAFGIYPGDNVDVTGNTVDSIGYSGMFLGSDGTCANNVVSNYMLNLSDGGGIYLSGSYRNIVRNNIVKDGRYSTEAGNAAGQTFGIYIDQPSDTNLVEGNTVIDGGAAGIFIQFNCYADTVRNNAIITKTTASDQYNLYAKVDTAYSGGRTSASINHTITGNTFFNRDTVARFWYQLDYDDRVGLGPFSLGTVNTNHYLNPYAKDKPFLYGIVPPWTQSSLLKLATWRDSTGYDAAADELFQTQHYTSPHLDSLFVGAHGTGTSFTVAANTWITYDGDTLASPIVVGADSAKLAFQKFNPVVIVDSASGALAASTTQTLSMTVSTLTNGYLIAFVTYYNAEGEITATVTWNGDAMTYLGRGFAATNYGTLAFGLANPDAGTHDIVWTLSNAPSAGGGIAGVSAQNVNQTTPIGTVAEANSYSTPKNLATSSRLNELIIGAATNSEAAPTIATTDTRVLYRDSGAWAGSIFVASKAGAYGTPSLNWSAARAGVAFSLIPAN